MQGEDSKAKGRKIAFCVAKWSHPTSVLAWAWLRQYFLHREVDQIFIVHTGKDDRWKLGGPVSADLDTALKNWPHQVVSLQGSLQSNISSFLERHDIDLVVLGEDFPRQGGFQITSVADWVKSNVARPFIIIRQSAVRNERLRLKGSGDIGAPGPHLSPESAPGRKVAIAYGSFAVGSRLVELSKSLVLLPQDEIFMVHCFPTEKKVVKTTKSILRTITLGLPVPGLPAPGTTISEEEVTEDNSIEFGAKELAGYSVNLNVVLRGEPRAAISSFCETEGIELLIISSRSAGRLRKTFSGGSVSGFLIDRAPCPCLVLPFKSLGLEQDEDFTMSPRASYDEGELFVEGGGATTPKRDRQRSASTAAPALDAAGVSLAAMQAQLEERDRVIADLREQVAQLRLEAAQAKNAQQHDPAKAPVTD